MGQGPLRDRFANIATFNTTETAANTLTFSELLTNAGIDASRKEATALLIDEIDYYVQPGVAAIFDAEADGLQFALTISSSVTDLRDMGDRNILDMGELTRIDFGTAAGATILKMPIRHQWFPPLITAERRLFLAVQGVSMAAAAQVRARMFYRTERITEGEFLEIAEVFRLVG